MQEWTDKELVEELYSENKFSEIEGKKEQMISFENLKRIVFDPRFPSTKSEKATDFVIFLQNKFNEIQKDQK